MLPTVGLAQLMLEDFAGQLMIDVASGLAVAVEEPAAEMQRICDGFR
jgi:hypothetical protein